MLGVQIVASLKRTSNAAMHIVWMSRGSREFQNNVWKVPPSNYTGQRWKQILIILPNFYVSWCVESENNNKKVTSSINFSNFNHQNLKSSLYDPCLTRGNYNISLFICE